MAAQNHLYGLTTTTTRSSIPPHSKCPLPQNWTLRLTPQTLPNPYLGSNKLLHSHASSTRVTPKLRPIAAVISFSLPTTIKERVSADEKIPAWSSKAIKAFAMSELEARKIRKPNTGTEALLMGILIEGTSTAAKFLRAYGITLTKVREETIKLLGEPNKYKFSPEHPPLTEAAQRVLDRTLEEKIKSGESGEITTTDLLLSIWAETDSPGQKILATLGFSDEKVKELKLLSSESAPGDD